MVRLYVSFLVETILCREILPNLLEATLPNPRVIKTQKEFKS